MAQKVNLNIYKGDDVTYQIIYKDSNDNPVDITGYTFFFTVKKAISDSDANAVITETWSTHSDPTNGITNLVLDNTQTNIPSREYFYDIQVKTLSNLINTPMYGQISVTYDITNSTT